MGFNLSQFVTVTGAALSSISAVFSSAVSTGSLLVAMNSYFNSGSGVFSTVTDNVNNAGFVRRIFSTLVGSTAIHILHHDKLNLSSGRSASTYRVSVNYSAGVDLSFCALVYDKSGAGNSSFGSTGSSNGTSTGCRGPGLTASTTPFLFLSGASQDASSAFNDTVVGTGSWITTINNQNFAGMPFSIIQSTGSSLAQQLTHSMNQSVAWVAGCVVYVGSQTAGGGGAIGSPWVMCMMGVQ
jgi:hypothetical protein